MRHVSLPLKIPIENSPFLPFLFPKKKHIWPNPLGTHVPH